jgi:hypothetical protein
VFLVRDIKQFTVTTFLPSSQQKNDGDTSSEGKGSQDSLAKEKKPMSKRRVFEKGFPLIPFAILTSLLLLGIAIAVCSFVTGFRLVILLIMLW